MFNNLGLALAENLKLCTSVAIGLKLKVRKFLGPNHAFVEVPGGKLVGGSSPPSLSWIGLKQALNHGLVLRKVYRVIQFNQDDWLKPYIDIDTKLRKERKNDFEKDFFKLMNNSVFGKTMENVRKHRDIKLLITDEKRNKLALEPNYHTKKRFSQNLLAIEIKKQK